MQPQHSCGTLESRIKIFGCTVQEIYFTFNPLDYSPLLYPACVHTKGFLHSLETNAVPTQFSKLRLLAVSRRYDLSKWSHKSTFFRPYL